MKEAAIKSLPIMFSYIFVSMAYGTMGERPKSFSSCCGYFGVGALLDCSW